MAVSGLRRLIVFGPALALMVSSLANAQEAPAPAEAAPTAAEGEWRHASSLVGTPKYPADFPHFDYVNPDAPKGGVVRLSVNGGFDSMNIILPRGDAAAGLGNIYETLMTSAMDEISTEYGLLAESLKVPDDISSVTYRLRAEARWHDGEPVTPEDVVWSFEKLKELSPSQRFYYQHVVAAEITGEREVTFRFDETGNRELPQIVGQLLVLPKHWWEGMGPNGATRNIAETTLEAPLGSGPYRIDRIVPGRTVALKRVPDHWGKDLPVYVGTNNFDEIRYEYFRDGTVELEAFKADQYDWRIESTAKDWATAYDFPAVRDGRVIKAEFEEPYRSSGLMVGFVPNVRRELFQDIRVREALNLALNFEEMNRTTFFGAYERISSYFFGLPFASKGLPQGKELEILESVRDQVPESVFTAEYKNPVVANPTDHRANLRAALQLLTDAGFALQGGKLINTKTSRPVSFEFLLNGPAFERVATRYQADLKLIGIDLRIRVVESSQYVNRLRARDFDVIYTGWPESYSPGNEQLDFFGSEAADREASRNWGGIKDPAVDALIRRVIQAPDRETLEAAVAALDRVLLANHYVVPGWTLRKARVAYWDRFGRPDALPEYNIGFPEIWWAKTDGKAKEPPPPPPVE
nr:extracellular solute-binding protein [Methylobrevis albus]